MTIKQQGGIFGRNPNFNDVGVSGDLSVDGKLGIGTDNPDSELVVENVTSQAVLQVKGETNSIFRARSLSSSGNGYFAFGDPEDAYIGGVNYNHSNDSMSLYVNNGTRLYLDNSGNATINTGNLVIGTSGKGIDFSATSGTGTSELFDDYEEGSWSPVISDATSGGNTGTATVYSATYTKIGNLVHLKAGLSNMNTTGMGSGNLYVQGVPFAADGDGEGVATTSYFTASANSLGITPSIGNNASYIKLKEVISGGVFINADSSQFTSGTADLWITITYHT